MGDIYQKPPLFVLSDDNLINGKSDRDCSSTKNASLCPAGSEYAKFKFISGKTYRLRLINAGATSTQKFSIDNHELTVIANDYVPIKPYNTTIVTLGVGQRTDILVTATGRPDDLVWMRSILDKSCFPATINEATALAAIYYPEADERTRPATTTAGYTLGQCSNVSMMVPCSNALCLLICSKDPLSQTVPLFPIQPLTSTVTQTIDIVGAINETGYLEFFVNNSSFHANYK